ITLGVPANCTVADGSSRGISVTPGETMDITFSSRCLPTRGNVRIRTTTAGVDPDPNGYRVSLVHRDTALQVDVPTSGAVLTPRLIPGSYTVTLLGAAVNCESAGPNPHTLTVAPGDTIAALYNITCVPAARLAFDQGYYGELWIVKTNGQERSSLRQLIEAREPAWSPDGARIAFTGQRDGNLEVYVANAEATILVRLTNDALADHSPAWSPDGTRIAFVRANSVTAMDESAELFVMNADGSNPVRLTNNAFYDGDPAWSPDGSKLAFAQVACHYFYSTCVQQPRIILTNTSGNAATLGPLGDAPAWSPDGRFLAYNAIFCRSYYYSYDYVCAPDGIGLMNAAGVALESISPGFNPTWRR
ncbi:MAG: TolB family protein, partial [Longimicrobiales bacterium]